jgi:hypothetical protein
VDPNHISLNVGQMKQKTVSQMTASFFTFLVLLGLVAFTSQALSRSFNHFEAPKDDLSFNWHPVLFKILTFGHAPAAVDGLLIRFMGEDNIEHVKPGVTAKVFYYLDLATEIDPAFFSLYTAGTNFLAVVRNDKVSALKLITKGENFRKYQLINYPEEFRKSHWLYEWRIPFTKGYVHLFEFEDLPAAQEAYVALDSLEGVPPIVQGMASKFSRPGGIYEVGMSVLKNMITSSDDPKIKRELEKKRESLFLSQYLFQLNESYKKYKGGWSRFKQEHRVPDQDLWGGRIALNAEGKIDSTTPRQRVLGLD